MIRPSSSSIAFFTFVTLSLVLSGCGTEKATICSVDDTQAVAQSGYSLNANAPLALGSDCRMVGDLESNPARSRPGYNVGGGGGGGGGNGGGQTINFRWP